MADGDARKDGGAGAGLHPAGHGCWGGAGHGPAAGLLAESSGLCFCKMTVISSGRAPGRWGQFATRVCSLDS